MIMIMMFVMMMMTMMHSYRSPQEQDGQLLVIAADDNVLTTGDLSEGRHTPIYEKYDALLHGNSR